MSQTLMACAVLLVSSASPAFADCKFEKMLKVVTQNVSPGVKASSFAAQPKTIYRIGTQYGRTEEAPDRELGIHGLIVVNEPDVWIVNLLDQRARHLVDPGPTFNFHAPVAWTPEMPVLIRDLEFGCELAFVTASGAKPPAALSVKGEERARHVLALGEFRVTLDVGKNDKKPRAIVVERKGKVLIALKYLLWAEGLEPDLELFKVPKGVEVSEEAVDHQTR